MRKNDEVGILVDFFSQFDFFKKYLRKGLDSIVYQLCRKLTLLSLRHSEVLFKKGDASKYFCIVIRGGINIYMNREIPEGGISRDATTLEAEDYKKTVAQICESLVPDFGHINFASLIEDPFFFDQKSLGFRHHLAVKYGPGASFGELGVLRSVPRAATAVANSVTVAAILDSDNFRKILHQEQWIKIERKMRFFKESMLHDLDYNNQVKIAYYFTKRKYTKGDIIFKQGELIKGFYIVKSGRVELRTKEVMDVLNLEAWDAGPDIRKMMEYNSLEHMGFKNWQNLIQKICEVGEKGLLNDWEEGKEGKFVEMYTALAASDDVVLYECNMHNLRWVRENFPKLWRRLRKESIEKNQQRREMVEAVKLRRIADEKAMKGITAKNKQAKIFSVRNDTEDLSKKFIPLHIERELTSSTKRIYKLMSQKEKVFEKLNSTSREDFEELVRIENRRQPNHKLLREFEKKRQKNPHSYQNFFGNFSTVNGRIVDFLRSSVSIDARSSIEKPVKQNHTFVTSRDNVLRSKNSSMGKSFLNVSPDGKKMKRKKTVTSQCPKHRKPKGPNSFLASGSSFYVHQSQKRPFETKADLSKPSMTQTRQRTQQDHLAWTWVSRPLIRTSSARRRTS
jgi:CRP-like cAMP-binding protein